MRTIRLSPRVQRIHHRSTRSTAWLLACYIAVGFAVSAENARAASGPYSLRVSNEFGQQLSDVGRTKVDVIPPFADPITTHLSCDPSVTQQGNQFVIAVTVQPGPPPTSTGYCDTVGEALLGPLGAGVYQVAVTVLSEAGTTLANLATSFTITTRGAKCNASPFFNDLIASPIAGAEQFHTRFETDPAYRARFGDVVYLSSLIIGNLGSYVILGFPTLQDPVRELAYLQQTGEFKSGAQNGITACFDPPPPDNVQPVVEYHNTILDHYFMTADAGEQAAIDAGKVGPGWVRTNNTFKVVVTPGCASPVEGGFHPVYRFAGVPDIGPNSHFFTVSQDECAIVRDRSDWHWQFEGAPFWATEPSQGACPSSTKVLYRAYNNGKGGTPNHRYSTDVAIINSMVAQGWVNEGVAMCVRP